MGYLPQLDALRCLAFLLVFLCHLANLHELPPVPAHPQAAAWIQAAQYAGKFGVDLFFALSGFLITALLVREEAETGRVDVLAFLARRCLRIWPLYFWTLLVVQPVVASLWMRGDRLEVAERACYALFLGNWADMLWVSHSFVGVLWSVSLEEQFYLAWPFLVRRFPDRRRLVLACLALATLVRLVLALQGARGVAVWANPFAHLDSFAVGAWLAVARHDRPFSSWLVPAGLALWVLDERFLRWDGPASLLSYPLAAVGAGCLLEAALRARPAGWPSPVLWLGRRSYGLYVYHLPALALAWRLCPLRSRHLRPLLGAPSPGSEWLLYNGLAMLFCILAAALSYRWLESPFLAWKKRYARIS